MKSRLLRGGDALRTQDGGDCRPPDQEQRLDPDHPAVVAERRASMKGRPLRGGDLTTGTAELITEVPR